VKIVKPQAVEEMPYEAKDDRVKQNVLDLQIQQRAGFSRLLKTR